MRLTVTDHTRGDAKEVRAEVSTTQLGAVVEKALQATYGANKAPPLCSITATVNGVTKAFDTIIEEKDSIDVHPLLAPGGPLVVLLADESGAVFATAVQEVPEGEPARDFFESVVLFAVDMAIDDDLTLDERLATIADAQTDELKSMFMKVFGRETQSKNDNWIRRAVTMRYRAMYAANSAASRGEKVYMLSKKATSNFVVIDAEGQMVLRRKARAVVVPAQIKSVQNVKQPGTSKALKTDSSINEDEAPKEKELGKTMHTWKSCPFARLAPVPTSHTTSGMITCANCLALDLLFSDTSWNR